MSLLDLIGVMQRSTKKKVERCWRCVDGSGSETEDEGQLPIGVGENLATALSDL